MLQYLIYILSAAQIVTCNLYFYPQDISVEIGGVVHFDVTFSDDGVNELVQFFPQQKNITEILSSNVTISKGESKTVNVKGINPGHVIIVGNLSGRPDVHVDDAVVCVTVGKSHNWILVSDIMGWIYFAAWSISFYPQIYENWQRKSVVGLNFDFLALNFIGFLLYSAFNIGLYAVEPIKRSYHRRHPHSINPVMMNDIVFSVHALLAVIATLIQCYLYEKENQKVSKFAKTLFVIYAVFLGANLVLSSTGVLEPIDFLYYCSYVKLSITFIKYIPQAYMNYQRKSTIGWSIGNIFLDFVGGTLSMAQMLVNSYNYNDWESIFGDVTKFGLGLFSVLFDVFFIFQHYVFYRHSSSS
ncbi:hypothetical protein RUM44_005191 [Polyplax serrata]|uniref:Cystinosin n=1 Tax=Polyplax serrata TaxID=468196 RepID=A0ABR1AED0_POLSC